MEYDVSGKGRHGGDLRALTDYAVICYMPDVKRILIPF